MKSIADRNRLRILHALMNSSEMCACEIIELLGVSGATVSRHMGVLINTGLVNSRKEGRWVYYSLKACLENDTLLNWLESRLSHSAQGEEDRKFIKEIVEPGRADRCRRKRIGGNR